MTIKGKIVITFDIEYEDGAFLPVSGDVPKGTCNLDDVACFADMLVSYSEKHDSPYKLSDPTAYSLEGFLADLRDDITEAAK